MKKFIGLILILFISICVNAQDKTYTMPIDRTTNQVVSYMPTTAIVFGAGDTISKYDSLYSVLILTNWDYPLKYSVRTKITKVSGTPGGKLYLYGKVFSSDAYTIIDSATVSCSGTTNTFTFTNITATETGTLTASMALTASDSLRLIGRDSLKYYGYKTHAAAKVNYTGTITSGVITMSEKPKHYRYLLVKFDATLAAQKFKVTEMELKLWK
jgi:hypothetical protein